MTVGPRGPVDVRIADGVVAEVGPGIEARGIPELRGTAVLPGLHDHHVHLLAMAAARGSVDCGPPHVTDAQSLAAALQAAPGSEWVRGIGYDDAALGALDRRTLDAIIDTRPVRIQHRSGALWVLNSAALELLRVDASGHAGAERDERGTLTGRLWRMDAWLGTALGEQGEPDLAGVGRELAAFGITGVTDATPGPTAVLARAAATLPQRVVSMGADPHGALWAGPYKIVLSDHALPGIDELTTQLADAHARDRSVAVHSVTRESLFLLLAALDAAGVREGDRVEHAAVAPPEAVDTLARLGVTVVTQPSLVARRGDDYLARVEPRDRADLWRHKSLLDAGVPVGLSSDAPYGDANPWRTIDAAARRVTASGAVVGAAEAVPATLALDALLTAADAPGGAPREVSAGVAADLVVLDCSRADMLARPDASHVRATLIAGEPVYLRDDYGH